jgi:hypothetical protein
MKTKIEYDFIQVYQIWVNGRFIADRDQHFPIESNIERGDWHSDFKKATEDYFMVKAKYKLYPYVYKDYIVTFYSIEINIPEFEKQYDVKFDLNDDYVQEMIPYYVDYNFNTVAEKILKFKK